MKRIIIITTLIITIFLVVGCGSAEEKDDINLNVQNQDSTSDENMVTDSEYVQVEVSMETLESAEVTAAEEFTYYENENGTYTISEYLGSSPIVVIPDEINGIAVTDISSGVFSYSKSLEAIRIGNNIQKLNSNAFLGCGLLKYVVMGDNVKSIGEMCFSGCLLLENVQLNNSLEAIEFGAFATLGDKLLKLVIPESVNSIEIAFASSTVVYVTEDSYAANWVVEYVDENPADAFKYVIE